MLDDVKIFPWDNDIEQDSNPVRIGARVCEIKTPTLDETNDFLNNYHYQKTCLGQEFRYGLYYKDQLIGLMTFGYARYNRHCQYELLRLCYHPHYKITGGSKKLFNCFIKEFKPNSIVSYCDKSKFTGDVYIKLGMKQICLGRPKEHFWRESDRRHITSIELVKHGADQLIGTTYGKGTNNRQILLQEGFEIIKDCGQDVYMYLDNSQYFGYVYCTTDHKTGMKYVGQHIGSFFDEKYRGSGAYLKRALKARSQDFTTELLEWCKQDISEREIFWINELNTLQPNGYNLTLRPQNFEYTNGVGASERQKSFAKSKEGKQFYKENGIRIKTFYASEKGKQTSKRIAQTRHEFCNTNEGKEWLEKRSVKYKEFCKTLAGEEMCKKRNQKLKDLNQTEEGKEKEQKRIQAVRDFYASEEGKAIRAKINFMKYSKKANSMSEEEWQEFLKLHPKTKLINYRSK